MERRFRPFIDSAPRPTSDAPPAEYSRLSSDAASPLLDDGGPVHAQPQGDERDRRAADDASDCDTCDTADEVSPFMSATAPAAAKLGGSRVAMSRVHEPHWQRLTRRYRIAEFACSIVMMAAALVFALIDVHQREIPSIKIRLNANTTYYALDPSINRTKLDEQVPMAMLVGIGAAAPVLVNLAINFALPRFTRITVEHHDTRDFLLSLLQSVALSQILTQFIKNQTGRFRPSFYDMCGWQFDTEWDGVSNLCTDAAHEKEGRKSFPSGHSSFAWSTMLLLTLYLLGRSRLNAPNRGDSIVRGGKKNLKLFLCFAPTLFASWVAITRSIDNWHHYSDILAGSVIGAVSACVGYFHNYGAVFSKDMAGCTLEELRRRQQKKWLESQGSGITVGSQEDLPAGTRASGDFVFSQTARSRAEPSPGFLV